MNSTTIPSTASQLIQTGDVVRNLKVCRDHFRMTIRIPRFHDAQPGQFVHLCPERCDLPEYTLTDDPWNASHVTWWNDLRNPLLRRAFSIAKLARQTAAVEIDVMYRVVGTATRWLGSLHAGDNISVMGPLGRPFPISRTKANSWLVAGGVGLPPLLWLAEALQHAGRSSVAFCGAQTRDLLALELDGGAAPATDARTARFSAREFVNFRTPVVISTDDGTLGFRGHIGGALEAFAEANSPQGGDLVVYTCGPERMMHFVAQYCMARNIECYVCVERNMACGTGMCQSCIVPVKDAGDPAGWRYRLCCTEGPVFAAADVLWNL